MARLLFDEPLNELKSSNKDGHLNTLFSDPVFTQNIRAIRDDYANVAVFTLIHNNYRPENIILRPPTSSCGSMVVSTERVLVSLTILPVRIPVP